MDPWQKATVIISLLTFLRLIAYDIKDILQSRKKRKKKKKAQSSRARRRKR